MFINAEPVFSIVEAYRLLHIAGKFGGHKTSLALAMFRAYGERGYRLITNTKTVWADEMEKVTLNPNGQLKAVVILDEGGQEFKTSRQIEMIAAYARKMDVIYIIPSYWPPAKVPLSIQPLFSLKSAGIPVIFYQWRVDLGGMHDKGWFIWLFPEEIYGIYSSQDPGDYCKEIIDLLVKRAGEFRKFHNRSNERNELQTLEEVKSEDVLADSMALFSESVDALGASLSRRTGRKRR